MKVTITPEAERRLWAFISRLNTEVGGFGYAEVTEEGLVWNETFLVPQKVSGSEVEFDGGGIATAVDRAANDGVLGSPDFVWVSWHSHHTMGAFWSNTDEKCIGTYAEAGIPMLLSFVGCHDRSYKMRLDFFDVEHHGIAIPTVTMDDVKFDKPKPAPRQPDEIDAEIKENVKKQFAFTGGSWKGSYSTKGTKQLPAPPAKVDEPTTIDRAFEIKELMDECGLSYEDALELMDGGGYTLTAAGLIGGFDSMAWGEGY